MDYSEINDNELIYLIRGSNPEYIDILFNKYSLLLKNISLYFSNIYNLPYDDVYLECLNSLNDSVYSYSHSMASFSTYARKCILNNLYVYLKKYYSKKNYYINHSISLDTSFGEYVLKDSISDYEDNYTCLLSKFNAKSLRIFLSTLPLLSSSIFELVINGFKYKEISELLDISTSKVNYELKNIRKKVINYFKFIDI